jgi:hypothetical protein
VERRHRRPVPESERAGLSMGRAARARG